MDRAWVNQDVNVVTIVGWAGVGKSTLVNHWLRRMAAEHYRSAELVFGWSFYRQGTSTGSADEFFADHEQTSTLRRDLEQLSSDAGAKLLRALGVKGDEAELRNASDEFSGHCLALTLLGSYLTDAHNGDVRGRKEVSERLGHDVRQGAHARKVMQFYQTWFGEGPELSLLHILGLFDRPADQKAIEAFLKPPVIHDLTESLIDLSPTEWPTILAKLRKARLISGKDPHNLRDIHAPAG